MIDIIVKAGHEPRKVEQNRVQPYSHFLKLSYGDLSTSNFRSCTSPIEEEP